MVNVFLSYSSRDKDTIEIIIKYLMLSPGNYDLWYYHQASKIDDSMEKIIEKLRKADLFVIFITHNSLVSPFVQKELEEAIKLTKSGQIKGFCPIIYDNTINLITDKRIQQFIKRGTAKHTDSPENAAHIIRKAIRDIE